MTEMAEIYEFMKLKHMLLNLLTGVLYTRLQRRTLILRCLYWVAVQGTGTKKKSIEVSFVTKKARKERKKI